MNTKPFFRYLRSKNKVRKTVNELVDTDGKTSKTPMETAETLLEFLKVSRMFNFLRSVLTVEEF